MFLSHNGNDKPVVERIAEQLKRAGLEPWLDAWCLVPGEDWQPGLAAGLRASRSCAVFVGPADLGAWANQEVQLALDRAAKEGGFRLFLVLLPGLPEQFDPAGLSPFLRMRTWVDYRRGIDDSSAFQELIAAVKGIAPGPRVPIRPADDAKPPYRGLETFDEQHSELFFGRDGDVQRLVEKLKGIRFVAVLGASGSGKSSIVRAGLVPRLKGGALPGSTEWRFVVLRPGPHPCEALASKLLGLGGGTMQGTVDGLRADPRTLHLAASHALADAPAEARAVFVIDQFEEVFTLCRDEGERSAFLDNVLYAASVPDGRSVVVLTLRADFYHRCAAYPELAQQLAAQQYLVSPMGPEGLVAAIEQPARGVGLEFEAGLVQTILDDVSGQPGALPLLEHALLELWTRRRGGMLTLEGYRETGGVQGAIAKRADEVLESLAPEEREIARRTFLRLTQPGEGTEDTRRRVGRPELTSGASTDALDTVLRRLVDARLLTTSRDDSGRGEVVEVAHEALIRGWPQLRAWIDASRAGLRVHRRLTEAAQEWDRLGRGPDDLYRGARLAEVLEWRGGNEDALNDLEREFVDASDAAEKSELREASERARRFRRLAAALAALLLFAVAGVVVAALALKQTQHAKRVANARALASSALAALNEDPARGVALARDSVTSVPTREGIAALRRALAESHLTGLVKTGPGEATAAVSGDGKTILTGNNRRRGAHLWGLPGLADEGKLDQPTAVVAAAFAARAPIVAIAGADEIARVFDARTRRLLGEFPTTPSPGSADGVPSVALSPDGRRLVTLSADYKTTRVWSIAPRSKLREITRQGKVLLDSVVPEFSKNRNRVVLPTKKGGVRVVDSRTLRPVLDVPGHAHAATLDPKGNRLWVTSGESAGNADERIWNVSTRKIAGVPPPNFLQVERAVFAATGDGLLYTDGLDTTFWSASAKKAVTLAGHESFVTSLDSSPDGTFVATSGDDGTARVWDPSSGTAVAILRGHRGGVATVAFAQKGLSVVTAGADGDVRVWDVERQFAHLHGSDSGMSAASFSPNGRLLAVADADGSARIWDLRRHQLVHRLILPESGAPNDVAFASDKEAVTAHDHGNLVRWDLATEKPKVVKPGGASLNSVAVFGRKALTSDENGRTELWDLDTGEHSVLGDSGEFSTTRAAFDAGGARVAMAAPSNGARVLDRKTGRSVPLNPGASPNAFAFSPDGAQVAVATDASTVVYDLLSKRPIATLHDPLQQNSVTYSRDGSVLATSSWDSVRIWDTATWTQLMRVPDAEAEDAAWSPNGDLLGVVVAAGGDVMVRRCPFCGSTSELLRNARDPITRG